VEGRSEGGEAHRPRLSGRATRDSAPKCNTTPSPCTLALLQLTSRLYAPDTSARARRGYAECGEPLLCSAASP